MRYKFHTADVFTDRVFGGNPLAVFPDGQGLSTEQMQAVAREFNLSETVFVLPPAQPVHTRRLRIFTPTAELPFAGHPTVGTAHVLAATGDILLAGDETGIVFEEGVGPVPVKIRAAAGAPVFAQLSVAQLPEFGTEIPAPNDIARALSLQLDDLLLGEDHPQAVSCGVPFLYVALRDKAAVGRARMAADVWDRVRTENTPPWIYLFSYETERPDSQVHARMFAPASGIGEDPATGAAAAALAGYLAAIDRSRDGTLHWVVEQGFGMGRPSIIEVEADKADGAVTAVRVGGAAVLVSEGTMDIPS